MLPNAVIPNEKPITDFEVPVEVVERASGLEFASLLPVGRRKRLCADTVCALVIRDYQERQQAFKKEEKVKGLPPTRSSPRNNISSNL